MAAIENKTAIVGIMGLGYVGLPLVQAFMAAGYRTMGFDVDQAKVDMLLQGKSYIGHIPGDWIAELHRGEEVLHRRPTCPVCRKRTRS